MTTDTATCLLDKQPPIQACRRARVRQGQAFGGAEEAPSLPAAARDGDANMRSGRKNACGAGRTKEWNDKGRQKWRDASLTNKAPYKRHTVPELGSHGSVRVAPCKRVEVCRLR